MRNILLVGLGNLGMRYVEGLMNIKFDISIDIIEPIKANYEMLAASKGINNNILREVKSCP